MRAGDNAAIPRAKASTAKRESRADVAAIKGREVMSNWERKKASRVALPATCWAINRPTAWTAGRMGAETKPPGRLGTC